MFRARYLSLLCLFAVTLAQEADDDVAPAPPSIGSDIPLTYFGPSPSQVQRELIGPFQLLKSGTINLDYGTITLPLYKGYFTRTTSNPKPRKKEGYAWYILTDTTDAGNAAALGLNHSPKLKYTPRSASRYARLQDDASLLFNARHKVDFSPERELVPGDAPNYFPPKRASPGSVGTDNYSDLFLLDGEVYNAPIIASADADADDLNEYCEGIPENKRRKAYKILHDQVTAICPREGTVTLQMTSGHSFARPVLYLSTGATDEVAATIESVTYTPGMRSIQVGGDDSAFSAVERIFLTINGYTNGDINLEGLDDGPEETSHPSRQGLNSAIRGDGSPLNVLGGIPTIATDYSPLWDANVGMWTEYAVRNNYRVRLLEEFQILGLVERGFITGPGGSEYGSAGFLVNCPIAFRFL